MQLSEKILRVLNVRHLIRLTILDLGANSSQLKYKPVNVGFLYILVTKANKRSSTNTSKDSYIYIYIYIYIERERERERSVEGNSTRRRFIQQMVMQSQGAIFSRSGCLLKLVKMFTFLSNNISSTESGISIRQAKTLTALDRLSIM